MSKAVLPGGLKREAEWYLVESAPWAGQGVRLMRRGGQSAYRRRHRWLCVQALVHGEPINGAWTTGAGEWATVVTLAEGYSAEEVLRTAGQIIGASIGTMLANLHPMARAAHWYKSATQGWGTLCEAPGATTRDLLQVSCSDCRELLMRRLTDAGRAGFAISAGKVQ